MYFDPLGYLPCSSPPSISITPSLPSSSQAELQQLEEQLYKERKEREHIIAIHRREVEECKDQAEKVDRRVRNTWWSMYNLGIL